MQHNWLCMLLEERKQGQPPLKRPGTDEGITGAMKKCDAVVTKNGCGNATALSCLGSKASGCCGCCGEFWSCGSSYTDAANGRRRRRRRRRAANNDFKSDFKSGASCACTHNAWQWALAIGFSKHHPTANPLVPLLLRAGCVVFGAQIPNNSSFIANNNNDDNK